MPAAPDVYVTFFVEARLPAFHKAGELAFCPDKVQLRQEFLIVQHLVAVLRNSSRESFEYSCDFSLLFGLELSQLVIQVDY